MPKARILVVEDESLIAMDLQYCLESLGHSVLDSASSGEEAIQKTAKSRPDLVLMDIILRGNMDGVEAGKQIRARYNIPVIYLTACFDQERFEEARAFQPFVYIIKPFDIWELETSIEKALNHR